MYYKNILLEQGRKLRLLWGQADTGDKTSGNRGASDNLELEALPYWSLCPLSPPPPPPPPSHF